MFSISAYEDKHHDKLVGIWYRAVKQTHRFLTDEDFEFFHQLVRNGVFRDTAEIWVEMDEAGEPVGLIGLDGTMVDMLFVDPAHHGKGTGTRLLRHAEKLKGSRLRVDVNEQNEGALTFYKRYGFRPVGRSELDGTGRPYPLLHLELNRESDN